MDAETSPLFTHPAELGEPIFWLLPVALALVAAGICIVALVRGRLPATALATGLVFLPVLAFGLGNAILMERSKATEFCVSCHVMEPILASASSEDGSLAARHLTLGAVPRGTACYTCHSGYGLWGGVDAKRAGVGHMIHTIRGDYDLPLALNTPYNIDACLACHAESRPFREQAVHQDPGIQEALLARQMSCTGACHPAAHPPEALNGAQAAR